MYKDLLKISLCGIQLLINTLSGLSSISSSYFHSTPMDSFLKVSLNICNKCFGRVDVRTSEPNEKYITPFGESSMNFNISFMK